MTGAARIVVVGATSAIAERCARLWAERGAESLTLVGRDAERLQRVADDLRVRAPAADIQVDTCDALDTAAISGLVERIAARGRTDIALIAHGMLPEQQDCQRDLALCKATLDINAVSPALFAETFAGVFAAQGAGTLAIVGSVAGDRGRKTNYVYGAAKGLVERYAQGLRHRFHGTGVRVVLIKPGPTATPMTAHLQAKGAKLASPEDVAAIIVRAIDNGTATVYAPGRWQLIMLVIRHLPAMVFNRLNI